MTYVGAGANDQQFRGTPKLPSNAIGVAGFYSTQDADPTPLRSGDDRSEGEEGKFFVWTPDEIREVLGEDGEVFIAAYGVTRHGNFEGKSILEFVGDMDQRPALSEARRTLYDMREKRFHPGLDDKVLTSWNGLMLAAFAEAARALDRDDYRLVAEHNAEFLLRELRQENGRLLRSWKERAKPSSTATWRTVPTSSRACWSTTRPPLSPAGLCLLRNRLIRCSLASGHRRACSWPVRANCQPMHPALPASTTSGWSDCCLTLL
jgi:hypothetical protein